ncbi:hypothetical protein AAHE18_19G030000 [Arachis hypogaea]|uniref:Knottin scorpion toxin-like domain-containing protein n=1 Tax=Arachis hypogaea TaxID=3818 RepID=A0A6B9V4J0_ARAHY|nr:uncharacterized protein DS421_19g638270 [Arachis hypogaea]
MAAKFTMTNLLSLFLLVLAICSMRIEVMSGDKQPFCREKWPASDHCLIELCPTKCQERAKERDAPFLLAFCVLGKTCFCEYQKECSDVI